jgi:predicted metal-dependent peptidase
VRAHKQDGFATMTGPLASGCYDDKYDDSWTEERIFEDLLQQQQQQGQGQGQGESFDDHDWDGAAELSEEEQQALAKQIDEALREGALAAGKMGAKVGLDIAELLKPQVDWRDVLREFVTTTCAGHDYGTWAKPNRRFLGAGVYMPSPISEQVEELVIAIDTSGSVRRFINMFLSELVGICQTVKPSRIRLLYWDTSVSGDERYEQHELHTMVQRTKPVGGGGTDVTCVPAYMKDHKVTPQAVVVLTDGDLYGGWGQWSCPVLWCVLDNKTAKPDTGKVVHINGREL